MPEGYITVRVGRVPGSINDITLNGGRTVGDALSGAGLSGDGYEVRVNGTPAESGQQLRDGDTVLLLRKVRGA